MQLTPSQLGCLHSALSGDCNQIGVGVCRRERILTQATLIRVTGSADSSRLQERLRTRIRVRPGPQSAHPGRTVDCPITSICHYGNPDSLNTLYCLLVGESSIVERQSGLHGPMNGRRCSTARTKVVFTPDKARHRNATQRIQCERNLSQPCAR